MRHRQAQKKTSIFSSYLGQVAQRLVATVRSTVNYVDQMEETFVAQNSNFNMRPQKVRVYRL